MKRSLSALALALLVACPPAAEAHSGRRLHRRAGRGQAHRAAKASRPAARPVAVYTHDGLPNIQAEAAVVVDLGSHQELFGKHADAVRPIASISKLMAMMVVLDHDLPLDGATEILGSDCTLALRGARSRLPPGFRFSNRDLLHAALMASDNRAVPALGRAVGLDPAALTAAMNRKSRELGLAHTSFGDPTGLDERNRSTPRELARMLAAALRYPLIAEITRKAHYVISAVGKRYLVEYNNTDQIARGGRYQVLGGKTGYTDLAGYCLAVAARLADGSGTREVAMVFLGDHQKLTRFGDFTRAAQWILEKHPAAVATAVADDAPRSPALPAPPAVAPAAASEPAPPPPPPPHNP
jgi:D-alanyl-D-alanine endopeptidase (penicillin-binding protein 7)